MYVIVTVRCKGQDEGLTATPSENLIEIDIHLLAGITLTIL